MADPIEITKDITVAWLGAYQTDIAIRRQKGVVPVFTPTYEEVTEFISMVYKKVSEISPQGITAVKPSSKKKT